MGRLERVNPNSPVDMDSYALPSLELGSGLTIFWSPPQQPGCRLPQAAGLFTFAPEGSIAGLL